MAVAMGSASVHLAVQICCNNEFKANAAFVTGSPRFGNKPLCCPARRRFSSSATRIIPRASSATAVEDGSNGDTDTIPTPKVIIDLDSDPDATIVEITFGDRLGALLDTMNALKNLGLNVVKANVFLDSSGKHNKFAITKAYVL
ncbi:hypothetical protein CISIN_1g032116mg [Citrus sinensis]|uniref:ACT domain-containing protein ACR n=1 Tax=Citrus sinensis TaxID=2711 RepID=A0A067DF75_CITSI|nr:hypothetical protein CISIN_1g032116mg [Citrus sinensis]